VVLRGDEIDNTKMEKSKNGGENKKNRINNK
jgi:hypothetical protein